MYGGADVLGYLRLRIDEQVPCNVHEFDEHSKILLDGYVIHDDQRCAFLRAHSLFGII